MLAASGGGGMNFNLTIFISDACSYHHAKLADCRGWRAGEVARLADCGEPAHNVFLRPRARLDSLEQYNLDDSDDQFGFFMPDPPALQMASDQ